MAGGPWMRSWHRDRRAVELLEAAARAASSAGHIEKILEIGARHLLQIGPADRAGVWVKGSHSSEVFLGTVVETVSGIALPEWKALDVSLPFFHVLLESQDPIVTRLDDASGVSLIGPLAGMSKAAWASLRVEQNLFGLAMVAYANRHRPVDTNLLRVLVDILALAVARAREHETCGLRAAELASWEQLQESILHGTPACQILPRIAAEVAQHVGVEFVALSRSTGTPSLDAFTGPEKWIGLIEREPIAGIRRMAMEQGRIVTAGEELLGSCQPQSEAIPGGVSQVIAIPLEVCGARLGVLLAGLRTGPEPSAEQERLAAYASLAAEALWQDQCRQRQAEAEIPSSARLESTTEPVLMVDRAGMICDATQAALGLLHLEPDRLARVRLEELFSRADRDAIASWRTAALSHEAAVTTPPAEGTLQSGTAVRVGMCQLPGRLPSPNARWMVFLEDMTPLQTLEQRARRAEAELLGLLDAVDSGVLVFDIANRVRLLNDRFAQLLGMEARGLKELWTFDALVEAVAEQFRDPVGFAQRWRELRRGEQASWDELELVRPTRKVVERFARPVRDAAGTQLGWLEVYRDITGQRLIQSKLLRTERMAALGQLVSGIAHELNNPLTSIMGYAQLLLGRRLEPEGAGDALKIYQEAERAGRIVKNLLLFTREAKPERRPVNLNELVERTIALRNYELKVENIAVEFQLDPHLPVTLADPTQMQQVILNLIVNAEQAIQQGRGQGHIRVRTLRRSPERLALEVADDGPGIPPEVAVRIFDPFFTTKPVGMGTGLGLSIVYGIVQEHGGEISVESQPGHGATFLVELPILAVSSARSQEGPAAPEQLLLPGPATAEAGAPSAAPRERVLVVEDEPTVAQLIADVLREEGYPVDTVLDSREGLELLRRQEYDLVICDLKMPHLDGRAFYRALVRAGSPLQHRMIFVTGDTLGPHTLEFLESTGLPYLAKPFLVDELKLAVQRAVRLAPAGSKATTGVEFFT